MQESISVSSGAHARAVQGISLLHRLLLPLELMELANISAVSAQHDAPTPSSNGSHIDQQHGPPTSPPSLPGLLVSGVSTEVSPTMPTVAPLRSSCTSAYRCTRPCSAGCPLMSRLQDSTGKAPLMLRAKPSSPASPVGPLSNSWLPTVCGRAARVRVQTKRH